MHTKKFDFLVFIGRFNPFHIGHWQVAKLALQKSERLIIIVGSANKPRTAKNPLTFHERFKLIASLFSEQEIARIEIVPCNDYLYNDPKWEAQIQTIVRTITHREWRAGPTKIGIIGHSKDHSSYYLKKFPQLEMVEVSADYVVNATDIRHSIYEDTYVEHAWFVNQDHLLRVLRLFDEDQNPDMKLVFKEYEHIRDYKKQFVSLPYPPIFVTVDAVVVQSGHILLVERGAMPGEGQWALPGGFVNAHETIKDAMLRELTEETKIGVRFPKLEGNIVDWFIADSPDRSQRGRTISHAALIRLPDNELPTIKGSDDARHAQWIELSKLNDMQNMMYEDHYDLISVFNVI